VAIELVAARNPEALSVSVGKFTHRWMVGHTSQGAAKMIHWHFHHSRLSPRLCNHDDAFCALRSTQFQLIMMVSFTEHRPSSYCRAIRVLTHNTPGDPVIRDP